MNKLIYADNAATTKLDEEAFEAMLPYLREEYGNSSSLYSVAREPKSAIKNARHSIAQNIGAKDNEVIFTSCGTESDNWAIKGTAFSLKNKGMHIITTQIEHHAVLHACQFLERQGFEITYLPVDSDGMISPDSLRGLIRSDTILVSVMLANNEIGTIQDIKKLSGIAHENGVLFHTDAVQAIGHIPIDVVDLGVDMLSSSAHKFNGPKGTGFLYLNDACKIEEFMSGGAQEFGKRSGTENIAGIVGMSKALDNNIKNLSERYSYTSDLVQHLLNHLSTSGLQYQINGGNNRLPGIISLSIKYADGEALMHRLDLMGIEVSTGSACNSSSTELSHVIKSIAIDDDYVYGTIRISLNHNNTIEEVDYIIESLIKIAKIY